MNDKDYTQIKIHKKQFEAFNRRGFDVAEIVSGFLNLLVKDESGFSATVVECYQNRDIKNFHDKYLVVCPNCHNEYYPVLGSRKYPDVNISMEFPESKAWEREQLLSGICSNKCWTEFLGNQSEDDDFEEEIEDE